MARIPVVGTKQLHTVQLSAEVRKMLHHRATAAARRAAAPVLAADREGLAIPQQEYHVQASADRGVSTASANVLASLLSGLGSSGLTGRYKQQTAKGLKEQQAAALSALPYLLAGANEERAKGETEARQQLVQDRATRDQQAAQGFNSLLKEERGAGSSALKKQEDRQRSHQQAVAKNEREHEAEVKANQRAEAQKTYGPEGTAEVSEDVQDSYNVALSGYKWLLSHHGEESKSGNPIEAPKTAPQFEEFAKTVAKESTGDYTDALQAVEMLRKQLARLQHQGTLPAEGSEAEEG